MYLNTHPHRLNGHRESTKYNTADGEMLYAEIQLANAISSLLNIVETNLEDITLSEVNVNGVVGQDNFAFSRAFAPVFA